MLELADVATTNTRYEPGVNVTPLLHEAMEYLAQPGRRDRTLKLRAMDTSAGYPVIDASTNNPVIPGTDGVTIQGDGPSSGFQLNPASYTGPGAYCVFNSSGRSGFTLRGFTLDGQRTAVAKLSTAPTTLIGNQFLYVSPPSVDVVATLLWLRELFNAPLGEGFALMAAGGTRRVHFRRCTILGVTGSGIQHCGTDGTAAGNHVENCTFNAVTIFGATGTRVSANTLRNSGKRNVNIENHADSIAILNNHCAISGYGNIGTYGLVTRVGIDGNFLTGAGGAGFPVGEIDIAGSAAPVEGVGQVTIGGGNLCFPKAGGYQVSVQSGAMLTVVVPAEYSLLRR